MEELEIMLNNMEISNFDINTEHWVFIIHINSPHNFYVHPTKYLAILKRLESLKPSAKASVLNENDMVIFNMNRSTDNPKYVRGRISLIKMYGSTKKYDIFAIDYGRLCRKMLAEYIWGCDASLVEIPDLALQCQLANCEVIRGKYWDENSVDAFKFYVANQKARMTILDKKSDKLVVELRNTNPCDIATTLAMSGYAVLQHNPNATKAMLPVPEISFKYKDLNVNDTLHVRVQSGKSLESFYVAEVNDYKNFLKERENITSHAKSKPHFPGDKFKKDALVCVKNNLSDKYERAVIKKVIVPKAKAIVKLVDWGTEERAHILNMKTMSAQIAQLPVLAIYCSTKKSQKENNDVGQLLNPGFEFLIKIKILGNAFESPNIVSISPLRGNT